MNFQTDSLSGIRWHRFRPHVWRPRLGAVTCFYRPRLNSSGGAWWECSKCGRPLNNVRTLAAEDGTPLVTLPPGLIRSLREREKRLLQEEAERRANRARWLR